MRRTGERGSALLVALGILVLLSIMGVTFTILARMEMQAAINFDQVTRAVFLAEAGLERALAELRPLYEGPLFAPRYDEEPTDSTLDNTLVLETARPYSATVAAAHCETWAGRRIDLSGGAGIYELQSVVLPSPVSDESAPYAWGGSVYGRLSDGVFDAWFSGEPPSIDTSVTPREAYRVLRGVVDLSGLVNVNRANEELLEGLLTYFGVSSPDTVATNIVNSRNDIASGPLHPFHYVHELVDRGLLTADDLYGEDADADGVLDTGEDDNGNGYLDGAVKDYITIYPITGSITTANSRININTAPEPVLFAVFYGVLGDADHAQGLARAVILYRSGGPAPGGDEVEGLVSERDPDGDGDESDATDWTGDVDTDDIYSDDNPFDGVAPFLFALPADWMPQFADDPPDDWLDVDGDAVPPELVADGDDVFDWRLFPNGPGGFSEFEYFMDYLAGDPASPYASVLGFAPTQQEVDEVKYNATTRNDVTYPTAPPTPRVVTAAFRYDSDSWLVISEGRVERGGEVQARAVVSAVVRHD